MYPGDGQGPTISRTPSTNSALAMDTPRSIRKAPRRHVWIACGVIALAIAVFGIWLRWPKSMTSIEAVAVQSGPIAESVPVNAVLTPSRASAVSTTTGGTVVEVVAFPGQQVKAGDPLLKLSNADLERQLAEAKSELAGAKSDLASAQADALDQANSLHMAQLNAENDVRTATMQLEAERKLQAQGIVSLLTMKKTEAERDGKIAAAAYAKQHVVLARTASQAKTEAAREKVAVLQSRVDSLQKNFDGLTLKAPFDGVVSRIDGKPGATVTAGTQLAEVITSDLQINLEVAEQFASSVRPGQLVRLDGGLTGRIVAMSPTAEGGVVKGRASIDGSTRSLRGNTSLPGEAILAGHGSGMFVAMEAGNFANRSVDARIQSPDGSIRTNVIRFGPQYRQQLVVLSGAQAGDRIIGLSEAQSK